MNAKRTASAFVSGALFGVGLEIAGMTQPAKVVGFLDVFGAWDASLAFVMLGAVAVNVAALAILRRRGVPLFDTKIHLPTRRDVDAKLIVGAALFGIGWGLGGYCPGPGLVSAGSGARPALLFIATMTVGMLLEQLLARVRAPKPAHGTT